MLLLLAIFIVPVVASYLAYYVWQPQGGVRNYGELIKPAPLAETIALARPDGAVLALKELRGKWVLLQVDGAACDTACERKLYAMRQVRLLQGRDQDRVLRLWVVADDQPLNDALLKQKFEGTLAARDPGGALIGKLPAKTNARGHIYVIDPLGNLMMRYDANPDLKRMSKDIGTLLKASGIG